MLGLEIVEKPVAGPGIAALDIDVYLAVIEEAQAREIPFAVGGSLAMAAHCGLLRNSKDLDLYVLPEDAPGMIRALTDLGFEDYYSRLPYDRGWIYRACKDELIVDVIWAMANRRADVDRGWLERAQEIEAGGKRFHLLSVEEMIWSKLYVFQRDRCDWPDILNLVDCARRRLDWDYLASRLSDDLPLLKGILQVYQWLRPGVLAGNPRWMRDGEAGDGVPSADITRRRAALLDSRAWLVCLEDGNGC
ncbi:MAG TPA: nucleotidyltransferase [Bryobacteraceae bacterium]|jgi:putative nucleotidyltransferase-like protein|nr:nucleotidyltransferase [Bryobacteraceae bacterium]